MLDQLFTADNFRRIYDLENRKGNDLASRFFPDLEVHTQAIREKVIALRKLRALKGEYLLKDVLTLKNEIAALKRTKSEAVDSLLERVSEKALESTFKIKLNSAIGPGGKTVYVVEEVPEAYFVVKQLQWNLSRLYRVKQANRHDLVSQIKVTLSDQFPYEIIRTDISGFYESIDRKGLIEKLEQHQLLSPSSKKYIKQILEAFGQISQSAMGIPRGVGISAYLAELYLRPFDRAVKGTDGLVLYCRYVDDILAVFARPPTAQFGWCSGHIKTLMSRHSLQENPLKTKIFDLSTDVDKKFEYLGYRFLKSKKTIALSPSAKKIRNYKRRMVAAFEAYSVDRHVDTRRSYRELVARIKFLTGNTRLSNSKSRAVTGVFFNNSLATNIEPLNALDVILKRRVKALDGKNLRNRLKKYSFTEGFEHRRFHNFSTKELQRIVRAWNNGEA